MNIRQVLLRKWEFPGKLYFCLISYCLQQLDLLFRRLCSSIQVSMYGALLAHFTCGQGSSQLFLVLGIRHKWVHFYFSLVPRLSRVYLDDPILIVIEYAEQFFDSSSAQVDFLLLILKMTLKLGYFLNLPVHFPEICP